MCTLYFSHNRESSSLLACLSVSIDQSVTLKSSCHYVWLVCQPCLFLGYIVTSAMNVESRHVLPWPPRRRTGLGHSLGQSEYNNSYVVGSVPNGNSEVTFLVWA